MSTFGGSGSSVRFESARLCDVGIFMETCDLRFREDSTVIVGPSGCGKTTLAQALVGLEPPPDTGRSSIQLQQTPQVTVLTRGDRELVRRFKEVILLSNEPPRSDALALFSMPSLSGMRQAVHQRTAAIFREILVDKPWKVEAHRDLDPKCMSAGEAIILRFAMAFAVRDVLEMDLPAVFDQPFAMLDRETRRGLRGFLGRQRCQRILLLSDHELDEDVKPHYRLESGWCVRLQG